VVGAGLEFHGRNQSVVGGGNIYTSVSCARAGDTAGAVGCRELDEPAGVRVVVGHQRPLVLRVDRQGVIHVPDHLGSGCDELHARIRDAACQLHMVGARMESDGNGPWSVARAFSLGIPSLLSPTGTVTGTQRPQFSWTSAAGRHGITSG